MVPDGRYPMPNHRITLSILILVVALILVVLLRNSRRDDDAAPHADSFRSSSPHQIKTGPGIRSAENDPRDHSALPASERVIASAGDQVVLKVYADRTFQVHLPDTTKDIFVAVGKDLFTSWDGIPKGVKIKIRNGAGEIFTAEGGVGMQFSYGPDGHTWYRPGTGSIEMPIFSSRRVPGTGEFIKIPGTGAPIEPVPNTSTARTSPRGKLADIIFGLSPRVRQQSGLEFKLAIIPAALPNARGSDRDYLSAEDFPRHETDWLDGNLLFDDE
jgi:hypothetical protein